MSGTPAALDAAFAHRAALGRGSKLEGMRSLIRNAAALNTNHTMELLADLKELSLPLLLLRGAKDQYQPLSSAERFVAEFPGIQFRVIPDSDHFLPLEKGEEVSQILIEFFG